MQIFEVKQCINKASDNKVLINF